MHFDYRVTPRAGIRPSGNIHVSRTSREARTGVAQIIRRRKQSAKQKEKARRAKGQRAAGKERRAKSNDRNSSLRRSDMFIDTAPPFCLPLFAAYCGHSLLLRLATGPKRNWYSA